MRTLSYTLADVGLARKLLARAMLRVSRPARKKVVRTMFSTRLRLERLAKSVDFSWISPC